ncbi:MAG TPA: thioredoxin family protein [Thermomicrobiaceae bacterium]|nr:thioredoxin family protein [Thermomicrobiaceae bacterium]
MQQTTTSQAAAYFEQGIPVNEYIEQMHENRELYRANIEQTRISDQDRATFGQAPLKILVLTEDWCTDSAQMVPAVARLAREVPGVELRLLRRDLHRDFAAGYPRADGYQAIPIFILLDGSGRELGTLIERPARATEEMAAETRRFQREHPELPGINRTFDHMPEETRAAVKEHSREWRQGRQDEFARYLLEDLAGIVSARKQ